MKSTIEAAVYPETKFGGFSDIDPTVRFYTRIEAMAQAHTTVIDFGCGRGEHSEDPVGYRRKLRCLKGRTGRVIGLDIDPVASNNPTLDEFRLLPAQGKWPIDSESADCLIADWVLEHLERPEEFFSEAARTLRRGGCVCARTSNALSYIALANRLIPKRLTKKVLRFAQPNRKECDVFPAHYRCNSKRSLKRLIAEHGFDGFVEGYDVPPAYAGSSNFLYRAMAATHKVLPRALRPCLILFARKA